MDFLDTLDAAVDGRCSCGCNTVITDASPSAWFAAESCSTRWHRTDPDLPDLMAQLAGAVAAAIRTLRDAFEQLAAAARRIVAALDPAGGTLRERLAAPPRPTPRIDPGSGLSAAPLGRPVFRPARTY